MTTDMHHTHYLFQYKFLYFFSLSLALVENMNFCNGDTTLQRLLSGGHQFWLYARRPHESEKAIGKTFVRVKDVNRKIKTELGIRADLVP